MVVADTSPLNYLVLIDQINLLPQLYGRVLIPESVLDELSAMAAPPFVRTWVTNLPEWIEVSPATPIDDVDLSRLHAWRARCDRARPKCSCRRSAPRRTRTRAL